MEHNIKMDLKEIHNCFAKCEIGSCHSGVAEDSVLLGYDAVSLNAYSMHL